MAAERIPRQRAVLISLARDSVWQPMLPAVVCVTRGGEHDGETGKELYDEYLAREVQAATHADEESHPADSPTKPPADPLPSHAPRQNEGPLPPGWQLKHSTSSQSWGTINGTFKTLPSANAWRACAPTQHKTSPGSWKIHPARLGRSTHARMPQGSPSRLTGGALAPPQSGPADSRRPTVTDRAAGGPLPVVTARPAGGRCHPRAGRLAQTGTPDRAGLGSSTATAHRSPVHQSCAAGHASVAGAAAAATTAPHLIVRSAGGRCLVGAAHLGTGV
jgi:hypothetical protein